MILELGKIYYTGEVDGSEEALFISRVNREQSTNCDFLMLETMKIEPGYSNGAGCREATNHETKLYLLATMK